jgi:hypothetical protein
MVLHELFTIADDAAVEKLIAAAKKNSKPSENARTHVLPSQKQPDTKVCQGTNELVSPPACFVAGWTKTPHVPMWDSSVACRS